MMDAITQYFPRSLTQRDFRLLWTAALISRIGDSVHEIALIWIVYGATNDPKVVSLTVLASVVPGVLFSLPAGAIADRLNRKYLLVFTSAVRGGLVLFIPAFAKTDLFLPVVLSVAFVSGAMEAVFNPAKNAILPNLVPEDLLESANSSLSMVRSLSNALYIVGGAVVGLLGSVTAFYIDAATFVVASGILFAIPTANGQPEIDDEADDSWSILPEIRSGVSYIRSRSPLPSIILLWTLLGLSMGPLGVTIPILTSEIFEKEAFGFGVLFGSIYLGIFVGGYIIDRKDEWTRQHRSTLIPLAAGVTGLCIVAVGVVPSSTSHPFVVAALILFASGLSTVCIWVPVQSLTHQIVPDENRGKVFSVISAVGSASLPLSVAVAGPLVATIGIVSVFVIQGALTAVSGAVILTATIE